MHKVSWLFNSFSVDHSNKEALNFFFLDYDRINISVCIFAQRIATSSFFPHVQMWPPHFYDFTYTNVMKITTFFYVKICYIFVSKTFFLSRRLNSWIWFLWDLLILFPFILLDCNDKQLWDCIYQIVKRLLVNCQSCSLIFNLGH